MDYLRSTNMTTKHPKISLYVPQQIFDCFKEFQAQKKLSMSQAGIVILAEYFGMESTTIETTERTTKGAVSNSEFEQLKQRVAELEASVGATSTNSLPKIAEQKTTSEPLQQSTLPVNYQVDSTAGELTTTKGKRTPHQERLRQDAIDKLWINK